MINIDDVIDKKFVEKESGMVYLPKKHSSGALVVKRVTKFGKWNGGLKLTDLIQKIENGDVKEVPFGSEKKSAEKNNQD